MRNKKLKNKVETRLWGIASLVLGVLSILLFRNLIGGLIFGSAAIILSLVQRKKGQTKIGIAGLIAAGIGVFITLIHHLWYTWSRGGVVFFSMVILIFVIVKILRSRTPFINKKWLKWGLIFVGIIVAIIIVFFIILFILDSMPDKPKECATKECFIDEAKYCHDARLNITEQVGTVSYVSGKESYSECWIRKTIVTLHEGESQEMRNFLEGKYTECYYSISGINEDWIYSLVDGLEECSDTGGLKQAMGDLIIFAR